MNPLRIYVDTSVFGGCFDTRFSEESNRFFRYVESARIIVLVSAILMEELAHAPARVRKRLQDLPVSSVSAVDLTPSVIALRNAYLNAAILDKRFMADATHVAAATIARADAIVSWNFKHLVRLDKIRAFNLENRRRGHPPINIVSPQEVRFDEAK